MTTYLDNNLKEDGKKKTLLVPIVFLIGLILILIARDLAEIQINKFVIVGYASIFLFVGSVGDSICMLCAMIPLLNGLPGTYILLVTAVNLVLKRKGVSANVVILTALFALLEMVASIWFPLPLDWAEIIGYLLTIFLFFYLLSDENLDFQKCLSFYFIGVVVFCFIDILSGIKFAKNNWIEYLSMGQFRFGRVKVGQEGMRISGNANELAYYAITGFSVGFVILKKVVTCIKNKVLICLAMVFILFSGALSLSRSYLITILILLLVYIFANLHSWRTILSALASAAIICAIIFFFVRNSPELYEGFVSRFADDSAQTGGGRFEIFVAHIKVWSNSFRMIILGAGITQYVDVLGLVSAQHNMVLQILECYGIVGASVFLIVMLKPLIVHLKSKPPIEFWMPVLSVLLFTQTIQFVNPYSLMLHYTIGIMAFKLGGKLINQNKVEV